MKKGSTPTYEIEIPFEKRLIQKARVLFGYGNILILKKDTDDLEISDNMVKVTLTQEETFMFLSDSNLDIQLRIVMPGGVSLVSDIMSDFVEKCIDEEVL